MKLVKELAELAIRNHPAGVATLLERLDVAETVRLVDRDGVAGGAAVLDRLSPHYATAVLEGVQPERAARLLDALPVDSAARILRRAGEGRREELLQLIDPKRASSIRSVLRFREGSAGALMDPDVLALPADLSAREALTRIRRHPELTRYNVYVVDQDQRLIGALNLRELLLARGRLPLANLMTPKPHRIEANADRASVLMHPGWKEVHSLPVVDEAGAFLGAIRYRVLRQLEEDLLSTRTDEIETSAALGQVIAAGARGLMDAFSSGADSEIRRAAHGSDEQS